jgi:hypothetical protein
MRRRTWLLPAGALVSASACGLTGGSPMVDDVGLRLATPRPGLAPQP